MDSINSSVKNLVIARQEELEKEFKIELPLNIDPYRYLFNFRVIDLLFLTPFIILAMFLEWQMFKIGWLNSMTFVFPLIPAVLVGACLLIKDPDRKNISVGRRLLWSIDFSKREKEFMFDKQEKDDFSNDIRSRLGVFNITSGCYETLDDRYVKVIKVSSVNLETMPKNDKRRTLSQWEGFLQEADVEWFPIMVGQYTKPVNLTTYLAEVREKTKDKNRIQRKLAESYIEKGNEIQKDRTMVSKDGYCIISQKGTDEQSLKELNRKTQLIKGKIEDMLQGRYTLKAKILDNEELFQLLYTTIDYENAQANIDYSDDYNFGVDLSISQEEMINLQREKEELERTRIL
ncbi:hypothetical protein LSG23_20565 (plasmid) [Bacillus velezensis]|uniref:hypothetical protein n=1 Tax=Bacillus velezensis TaxID=492670 RepID=UPI000987E5F3|nr:hypothetical protein [Bacillus velezensis]AQS42490.1 hypothetical protein BVH55_00405 [Bacillus velezensis]WNR83197.1 hypothetical protein RP314_20765 [Bacillus velezensis]